MRISLPNEFEPRPYQIEPMRFFDRGGRRAILVWARRLGKDLTALHQTCKMMHERVGSYWHVFPTETQGRKAIWTEFRDDGIRIMENVFPKSIRKTPKDWTPQAEMVVELKCGSVWRLMGSDKIDVVGAGPKGVVFSEFALAKPGTWDLIRPMLRQNDGWAMFVSTPRGANHLKKLYDQAGAESGWFRDTKTIFDVGQLYASVRSPGKRISPAEMIDEERAEGMPEAKIRQEYLCDWTAANVGSVWGEQMEALEKGLALVEFDHPTDGVFTTWDMGISDAMSIWFWRINEHRSPDLIDHYEATGKPLSHFFDVVEEKPYSYVKHWVPHDARARTYQTGVSTVEMFCTRFGKPAVAVVPGLSFEDGIQAARWLLQQRIRFHPRCGEGIEALKSYHYEWDEDSKVFSNKPAHDWSSHTADAFRYVACVVKATEQVTRPHQPPQPGPHAVPLSGSFTLDRLFEDRERDRRG